MGADDGVFFLFIFAFFQQRDDGADVHDALFTVHFIDELDIGKEGFQFLDAAFHETLIFLCGGIIGIFGNIALFDGVPEPCRDLRPFDVLKLFQFILEFLLPLSC